MESKDRNKVYEGKHKHEDGWIATVYERESGTWQAQDKVGEVCTGDTPCPDTVPPKG